jgi:hypothetical protein
MTIFVFVGQFFFQSDVFKLQEVFSQHRKFPDISYLTDLRRTGGAKKIPKAVLKTRPKLQQTNHAYFCFRKIPYGLFPKPLNMSIFSVIGRCIEDYFFRQFN